jgi:hypothetical protein
MTDKKEYPYCFGKVENVFPMGQDGLRGTPESCLPCYCKTDCLRSALENADGLKVKQEKIDRAYAAGMIGFLERWSQKKELDRKMKQQKKIKPE